MRFVAALLRSVTDSRLASVYEFWRMHPDEIWMLIQERNNSQNEKWDTLYRMLD